MTNRRRLDHPPAHEDGIAYRHLGSNSFLIQYSDEHVSEQFVSHRVLSSWKKLSRQGTITSAPVDFSVPRCASTAISSRSQIGLGVFREVQGPHRRESSDQTVSSIRENLSRSLYSTSRAIMQAATDSSQRFAGYRGPSKKSLVNRFSLF